MAPDGAGEVGVNWFAAKWLCVHSLGAIALAAAAGVGIIDGLPAPFARLGRLMPFRRLLLVAVAAAFLPAGLSAQPIKRADVKPGLVFTAAGGPSRLEPGVGVTLDAGPATSTWVGTINVLQAGKYRFDATVAGQASVSVGGKRVFEADQASAKLVEGVEIELPAGLQPFRATLATTQSAGRLELLWRGPGFRTEPVPYYFFGHTPAERPAWTDATLAREHGRFLVEEHACVKCHAAGE